MTDTDAGHGQGSNGQAPDTPGIRILAQFIRDLSFENPRAPESLRALARVGVGHSSASNPWFDAKGTRLIGRPGYHAVLTDATSPLTGAFPGPI